jgi:hypothetical protein
MCAACGPAALLSASCTAAYNELSSSVACECHEKPQYRCHQLISMLPVVGGRTIQQTLSAEQAAGASSSRCAMAQREGAPAKRVALEEGSPLLNAEILPLVLRFADPHQFLFLASVCSYWKQGYLKHIQTNVKDLSRGGTSTCSSALLFTTRL